MKHEVKTASDLGHAIRAVRKASGTRLDDLAAILGVSKQTTANLEYGKDTVALGTVLRHLHELGIRLYVDIPGHEATEQLLKLSRNDPDAFERIKAELEPTRSQPTQPSGFRAAMSTLAEAANAVPTASIEPAAPPALAPRPESRDE
ncbi:helix-turn-helix domain-containing protein [Ottowia thiooxydans]|uniref:Transcriptional regulator with XRE-family HTH domain n=1 Tax=Ottowia thiooxydans TaxID=219182 RepID=A0ABV2Q828_9BURK